MKTSRTNKSFPNGKKIILYVTAIALFCFLNCLALQARDYRSRYIQNIEFTLNSTSERQSQAIFQFLNWNGDFQTMILTYILQQRISRSQVSTNQIYVQTRENSSRPLMNTEKRRVDTRALLKGTRPNGR